MSAVSGSECSSACNTHRAQRGPSPPRGRASVDGGGGGPSGQDAGEGAGAPDTVVGCAAFLAAFEATWLYEHYLVALRTSAFGADRSCEWGERFAIK